jgi:hypothetical protein
MYDSEQNYMSRPEFSAKMLRYCGVKQIHKGSIHDQGIGNEGVNGTAGILLKLVSLVCRRGAASYNLPISSIGALIK